MLKYGAISCWRFAMTAIISISISQSVYSQIIYPKYFLISYLKKFIYFYIFRDYIPHNSKS